MADYSGVLSELREQRASLRKEITKLDSVISGLEEITKGEPQSSNPTTRRTYPYRGLTTAAAARKCLEMNGGAMNANTIAAELLEGGLKTNSKKFNRMIYNVMLRNEDFQSEDGMWSLVEDHNQRSEAVVNIFE